MSDNDEELDEQGKTDETEHMEVVRDRFKRARDAMEENSKRAQDCDKFSAGLEQWPDALKNDRKDRPCMVMDETNQYINQIKNDQRQNDISIKVRPVDDYADKRTAEMFQGLIRHIEDASNADLAYDNGFELALRGGYGYWRVTTKYTDENSFDQEPRIERIKDRFSVYLDPDRQEPDGSDAEFGFVTQWIRRDEFKEKWPEANDLSWKSDESIYETWIEEDQVRIADYYFVREEEKTLVLLPDGSTVFDDEIPSEVDRTGLKTRKTTKRKVIWQKVSGAEVLEETEWMGKYIPIVEVVGNESIIDGKRQLTGIVYAAMDAQRMHNYSISAMVENVALAPKAPYVAATGQLEGYEDQWRDANKSNISVLPYHPVSVEGVAVPPPSRQPPVGLASGWTDIALASKTWVQASMGMYAASIGAPSNEKSGRAIIARQREGDVANFHYHDNLARAVRFTGRILIDIIPKVIDSTRVIRILGEDGKPETARIDPTMQGAYREAQGMNGDLIRFYNPSVGRYDVTVDVGPSYSTKRQEAAEAQTQLVQSAPNLLPLIGDVMIRNMDWPGADQIADRLKAMLPPQIQQLDNKDQAGSLQAKMTQMAQADQVLQQKAHALFQKEQQLQQAEQQVAQAGQMTAKQQSELEAIKNEMEKLSMEIEAERKLLAAEKARITAELKLAQADLTKGQEQQEKVNEAVETRAIVDIGQQISQFVNAQSQATAALIAAIQQLTMATTAPKRYIYDPDGNIIGSEPVRMQ